MLIRYFAAARHAVGLDEETLDPDTVVAPSSPGRTALGRATPGRAVSDQAAPVSDQAAPDQAVSDQAAPDQAAPDRAVSDQAAPDQAVSVRAAADGTAPSPATLGAICEALVGRHPGLADVLPVCSFLVDGVATLDETGPVPASATVDVLPPFAGG